MFASELYDIIKEQVSDHHFTGMDPWWHYRRARLLMMAHLMDKVEQPIVWRFK